MVGTTSCLGLPHQRTLRDVLLWLRSLTSFEGNGNHWSGARLPDDARSIETYPSPPDFPTEA